MEWQQWAELAGFVGTLSLIIGIATKQAKWRGTYEERLRVMEKLLEGHAVCLEGQTSKLAEAKGDFKVIASQLLEIGINIKEMRGLLLQHLTEKKA
jgi:hypothetical protein